MCWWPVTNLKQMLQCLMLFVVSVSSEADGLQFACWHSSLLWFSKNNRRSCMGRQTRSIHMWRFGWCFCYKIQQRCSSYLYSICFAFQRLLRVTCMPYHTVPFGLPCHSFTTDSTEASFNGGPMHLPTRVGREGSVSRCWWCMVPPLYWLCVLNIMCEVRQHWRDLCLLFNELGLCIGYL